MTPYRLFQGQKIYIHDWFQDGHINLFINNINAKNGSLNSLSNKLSEAISVKYYDQNGAGKRVWWITRNQFNAFKKVSS